LLIVIPEVTHVLKSLKHFLWLFFFPGVNVLLQMRQRYLNEEDFEHPHLVDLPPQKGQQN